MEERTNWFKKHADTLAILGAFAVCFWTFDGKLYDMNTRLNTIDHRLTVIETVLVMKNIMPQDLSCNDEKSN
jgi:hypothetical protein